MIVYLKIAIIVIIIASYCAFVCVLLNLLFSENNSMKTPFDHMSELYDVDHVYIDISTTPSNNKNDNIDNT